MLSRLFKLASECRKGYPTADHAFVLKSILNLFFNENKYIYACFVDFREAHDSVLRNNRTTV